MSKLALLLVLFSVWISLLTLLPAYMLMSGQYTLVRNDDSNRVPTEGHERWQQRNLQLDESDEPHVHHVTKITGTTHLDQFKNVAVEGIDSLGLQAELQKVLAVDETDARAAFDKVVALSFLLPKITNISRIKTPSPEAFRNYIAPVGLPVIFTDMLEDQLLSKWTWDYVRAKWGDYVFHNTRQGNYSTRTTKFGKHYVNRVSVRLADFIDVVTGKREPSKYEEGLYITKQRVIPVEALETEFYYPPFYPGSHKNCYLEPTGWIGVPGTFTQGHIDSKDNFVYQIIGDKRWTIFSPQDYKYLYYTKEKGSLEWSAVLSSLEKPDLKKYPLYSKTTPVTFTLKAGEVLYLPRGWTHFVENLTPTLMINTWRYGPAAISWYWSKRNREEIKRRCF